MSDKVITVSWSSLSTWESCPQQWDFKYGPGKVKVKEDMRGRSKGLVVALLFDQWVKLGCPKNWMYESATAKWEEFCGKAYIRWKNPKDRSKMLNDLLDGVIKLEHYWFQAEFDQWNCSTEVSFNAVLPEKWQVVPDSIIKLRGKIDILCQRDGYKSVIGDLKFTKDTKYAKVDQLKLYATGLRLDPRFQLSVAKLFNLLPFRSSPWIIYPVSEDIEDEMCGRVVKMVEGIRSRVFPATGDLNTDCYWCPWRMDHCPKTATSQVGIGEFVIGETPSQPVSDLLPVSL